MWASATAGAGTDVHTPLAATTRSGYRSSVEPRGRFSETERAARAAAIRRAAPSPAASDHGAMRSSRIRSRMRCRSAGIVDQAMTRPRPRRRARRARPRRPGPRQADRRRLPPWPGTATARAAASWPSMIASTRRSSTSARVRVPVPRARRGSSAGKRQFEQQIAERVGARRGPTLRWRAGRPVPARVRRAGRRHRRTRRAPRTSIRTRTMGTSGRRVATAATSVASSRIAPRSSARGGSPAPTTMASIVAFEQHPGHRERIGRLDAGAARPPAAAPGRRRRARQASVPSRRRSPRAVAVGCGPPGSGSPLAAGRRSRAPRRRPDPRRSCGRREGRRPGRGRRRPGWRGCR